MNKNNEKVDDMMPSKLKFNSFYTYEVLILLVLIMAYSI